MINDGFSDSMAFTDRMMCGIGGNVGRPVGTCSGDSGGALVRRIKRGTGESACWVQLGIVSWGLGCATLYDANGRTQIYPGFYTKLLPLMLWVKATLNEEENCPRNLSLVEEGRQCRKSCLTDADCRGASKRCQCDDVCGMSCFNPDAECVPLPDLRFGRVVGNQRTYKKNIFYHCREGYMLYGNESRTCRSDKKWSGSRPECRLIRCQTPVSPENGAIEIRSFGFLYGTEIAYNCDQGYILEGNTIGRCNQNKSWGQIPTCVKEKYCTVPKLNSKIVVKPGQFQRFERGQRIKYTCKDGYHMLDNSYGIVAATCLGRDWSHQPPTCFHTKPSFISASFEPGHEIYFLFDLSRHMSDPALNISLTFAVKLVQRLEENSTSPVEYSIFVFASQTNVMLNFTDVLTSSSKYVTETLHSIYRDRESLQREIRTGRNIYEVLNSVESILTLSRSQRRKTSWKRHILLFVSRNHNLGPSPQSLVTKLSALANSPMFYVITTCVDCLDPRVDETRYTELLTLSQKNVKNVYFVESFYQINDLLDLMTDARIDYSVCGRAGDVGSIKQQARLDRIVNGDEAADRSWPWQVVITKFHGKVVDTYKNGNFYGGGSVINNRWVLTAAHLFEYEDTDISDWANDFVVTFGLHKRPTNFARKLLPIVRAYFAEKIVIHENFKLYNFNVALVKIGHQLIPGKTKWEEPILNVGWVNYTDYIRPVCLPCMENNCLGSYLRNQNVLDGNETEEKSCTKQSDFLLEANRAHKTILSVATGFGHTTPGTPKRIQRTARASNVLRQGLLRIQDHNLCRDVAENIDWGRDDFQVIYTENMLCGVSGIANEGVDTCKGDSGGPLVREVHDSNTGHSCWLQIGIVSWGWGCGQTYRDGGIDRPIPGYYTNLMRMMRWVKENIAENPEE
ncbi:complement factor B-like [Clavelina lepadiformis]|uniref:complement factor B-like n=1 Tax=Clavelina lepadiformis TaxID=159417 RepID=UPI004041D1D3